MSNSFNCKVFFYTTSSECSLEGAQGAWFQDLIVNLAEGFRSLEVQYYSSNNYWQLQPEGSQYLLQHNPNVTHKDCDIVVLERQWFEENRSLPQGLFDPSRKYITVFLDCLDGIRTFSWLPEFREFDFIFKTHYIRNFKYPSNVYPWAFGLSNRVLHEISDYRYLKDRTQNLLVSFRHTKRSHSLRRYVEKVFLPEIQDLILIDQTVDDSSISPKEPYHYLRWVQTGRRHYPNYYKRLRESTACTTFGGFFLGPQLTDSNPKLSYYTSRIIGQLGLKTNRVIQWDSWRLWESLAAGCVTFHVDFEKYGFVLPVMPKNWVHYIGIDLDNIQDSVQRAFEEPELFEKISIQGRAWALQHYSPEAVSARFLDTVLRCSK